MAKKLGILVAAIFLAGCGPSQSQLALPTVTSTQSPPALASMTPILDAPTNTPLPRAPNSLLREEFTTSPLDNGWSWYSHIRPEIVLSEGWLMLETGNYDLLGLGGGTPMLVHAIYPGDLILQTHFHFQPEREFQSAGIAFFTDYDHFVSLARGYCSDGPGCVGDGIYLEDDQKYILGESFHNSIGNLPEGTLYLRIVKTGDVYTGFYSADGVDWIRVGSTTLEYQPVYFGVYAAANGAGFPSKMSFFDFVEVIPYNP